jgi:predicted esterase
VSLHTIRTTTHGRYLVEPVDAIAAGVLVGFHGQGETAAIELEHLRGIRGPRPWMLVSIQGLHRYYTRRGDVVAAWMTREDRELAIADNVAYVRAVLDQVTASARSPLNRIVFCGFSQGTAMAYRAAAFSGYRADGLIILAGDLAPDVAAVAASLPPVLIGRGSAEGWYTADKAAADVERLRGAGVHVAECVFDAGHARHPMFSERAGRFLDEVCSPADRPAPSR